MAKNTQASAAEKIRSQYEKKQPTALDELRELDRKVKRPARILSYIAGTIGALTLGGGMSMLMTDILGSRGFIPGLICGIVGLFITLINYPAHKYCLAARREKYAERILSLSDKVLKEQNNRQEQ